MPRPVPVSYAYGTNERRTNKPTKSRDCNISWRKKLIVYLFALFHSAADTGRQARPHRSSVYADSTTTRVVFCSLTMLRTVRTRALARLYQYQYEYQSTECVEQPQIGAIMISVGLTYPFCHLYILVRFF